jgi:putative glutamine amidotransferase
VPDLYVLALRHERAWGSWKAVARTAKRRKLDWFGVHTVRCKLPEEAVFRRNDCTDEIERLVGLASGVLVPGGPDLPPALYGEKTALTTRIASPNRHRFEATLLWHLVGREGDRPLLAERPTLPILAICLGMQTLNVAAGGDLVQDLRAELYDVHTVEGARALPREAVHRNPAWELYPAPSVTPGTWHPIVPKGRPELWERLVPDGEAVSVLSNHHQAVDRLGAGLEVLATSVDGRIVEALGHERFPRVLGIQFHPEPRALYDPDRKARPKPGSKVHNHLARRMEDPRVLRLHQELWRTFAGWIVEEAARR